MKKLNLLVTEKCDIKCAYCINKNKANKTFNPYLLSRIPSEMYDVVILCGGEPGLLTKKELNLIKERIHYKTLKIFTNGLFLKRHGLFFNDSKFVVHLTDNKKLDLLSTYNENIHQNLVILSTVDDLEILDFYAKNLSNVFYEFPHNQRRFSVEFIEQFCLINKKYKNIQFNSYYGESVKKLIEKMVLSLNPDNFYKLFKRLIILNKLKNFKNTEFIYLY